jgi:large subunit ribosomal protein L7/L12
MALSEKAQQILDLLKELTLQEMNELVKAIEEEFGVSAAAMMVAAGGAAGGGEGGAKDTFNVELTEIGQKKIAVIKAVKELLGVGLKEAKELVEKAPVVIKENVKEEEAEQIKAKLEEAGATVTLK